MNKFRLLLPVLLSFILIIYIIGCGNATGGGSDGGGSTGVAKVFYIVQFSGGTTELVSINPDGTGRTVLAPGTGSTHIYDKVTSSQNGTKILVEYGDTDGDNKIDVMKVDGSDIITIATGDAYDGVFSPDMTRVAYVHKESNHTLEVINLSSGAVTVIATGDSVDNPSFSSDGQYIVYEKYLAGVGVTDIYYKSADGTGSEVNISNTVTYQCRSPQFSPADPDIIIYKTQQSASDYIIKKYNKNTTSSTTIVSGMNFMPSLVRWSMDGGNIYFPCRSASGNKIQPYKVSSTGTGLLSLEAVPNSIFEIAAFYGTNKVFYVKTYSSSSTEVRSVNADGTSGEAIVSEGLFDVFDYGQYP